MKTDIHPEYNAVVFRDLGSGDTFLTRSTVTSDKMIELDGVEYPVIDVEVSADSHPFWTGRSRTLGLGRDRVDLEGEPLQRSLDRHDVPKRDAQFAAAS